MAYANAARLRWGDFFNSTNQGGDIMSLVRAREQLHAIDVALSEIQKAVTKAGKELLTTDSLLGAVMGEASKGNSRGPTRRRARKVKVAEQEATSGDKVMETSETVAIISQPRGKRGRPRKVDTGGVDTGSAEPTWGHGAATSDPAEIE